MGELTAADCLRMFGELSDAMKECGMGELRILKPLEWRHWVSPNGHLNWAASTVLCELYVMPDGAVWEFTWHYWGDDHRETWPTREEAQARAEQWYHDEMKSAFVEIR